jgi:NitT/TauT family transport system substrate-binding protein
MYDGTPDYVAIIVRKDSPLRTAADLQGRTLGTSGLRDLSSLSVFAWMEQHGADYKQLKIVETPFSVIAPALEEGRIDAGALLQPFLTNALASGKERLFINSYAALAPKFALSGWIANPTWVDANTDALRRFVRVMRDSKIYCNQHHAETAALMAQYSGSDVDAINKGGRLIFTQTSADPRDLQPLVDVAAKYGAIDRRFDALDMISPAVRDLRP